MLQCEVPAQHGWRHTDREGRLQHFFTVPDSVPCTGFNDVMLEAKYMVE